MILLDTQLLVWTAGNSPKLSRAARDRIENEAVGFSVVSIWEAAIKYALNRALFPYEPNALRAALRRAGYEELQVTGQQAAAVASLPRVHKDPFDRLLVAQAMVEGSLLLTADRTLAGYGPAVVVV